MFVYEEQEEVEAKDEKEEEDSHFPPVVWLLHWLDVPKIPPSFLEPIGGNQGSSSFLLMLFMPCLEHNLEK